VSHAQIEAEVVKADPAVRRGILIGLPLAAALLYGLWRVFGSYLDNLRMDETGDMVAASQHVGEILGWVLLGGALLLALLAWFRARLARRIAAAKRYPFAGARLFHDMRVLRGPQAAAYARRTATSAWLLLTLSYLLLAGDLLLPGYLERLHPILAQGHFTIHYIEHKGHKP
jgi:hypothetical protein